MVPVRAPRAANGSAAAAKAKAAKAATAAGDIPVPPYVFTAPSGDGTTLPRVWQYMSTSPETAGGTSPNVLLAGAETSESADNAHALKSKLLFMYRTK
jgi:hypothetical protein